MLLVPWLHIFEPPNRLWTLIGSCIWLGFPPGQFCPPVILLCCVSVWGAAGREDLFHVRLFCPIILFLDRFSANFQITMGWVWAPRARFGPKFLFGAGCSVYFKERSALSGICFAPSQGLETTGQFCPSQIWVEKRVSVSEQNKVLTAGWKARSIRFKSVTLGWDLCGGVAGWCNTKVANGTTRIRSIAIAGNGNSELE